MRPPLSVACVSDGDAARGSGHRYRSKASSDRSRIFDFDAQLLRCGRERPQRCAKLAFFLRFLSDRLPPDHAQPSRARPYFAVHQVRSLAFRLQVRHWHGHRAHPGAGLTALQDEAGRHRSDDCSPSSRSAAAEGARTASQLAPHSPAPDPAWQFASEAQFSRSAATVRRVVYNRSRQRAVAARHGGGFGAARAEGLATGLAGRFRGGAPLRAAVFRRGDCMRRVAGAGRVQVGQNKIHCRFG